ncbi:DUF2605 domain-containing protein [Calothrix sp. NIES-3974]|uniref:DUF2605 domain-containing protein n=1 Tax=Calothrix sp. NIES-3974 TaxID=2005462 RepID=UPI000B60D2FF|nr:DUF2605 domain-containing protein [Calothrix sp. NIES-3974]BAZ04630.1 hypothetical protein NIES3974_12730 [Calothrix sp. NIES-3974]
MPDANLPESELLKSVLSPLLEDFQYWFGRSQNLLETERLSFMSDEEQADLLTRVKQAQAEVSTAKMLFAVADGKVGIDLETVMPWHRLVHECWGVAIRHRSQTQA